MKNFTFAVVLFLAIFSSFALANEPAGEFKIGSRGLNVFSSNTAVIYVIEDPAVRGVSCFVTTVEARGMTLSSDPSNSSIACRQTGVMYEEDLSKVNQSREGESIFGERKGGFNRTLTNLFKKLEVRRIWNASTRTYIYVSYTTKAFEGSHKVSTSVVTTYGAF